MSKKRPKDTAKPQKKHSVLRRIGLWLFAALLAFTAAYGANNRLEVSEYTYASENLPLSFDGFRIVQLSDLHNKVFAGNNAELLRQIRELHPDLIVLTGDMVDASTHTRFDDALRFMEQIPQIAPTYYVTGNHEHLLPKADVEDYLNKAAAFGVRVLHNEWTSIESPTGQSFTLIGMDDTSLQANLLGTLSAETTDSFRVLLAHEPQFLADHYAPAGVDLVFSGHAHGGQVHLPFFPQGLYAPDQGILPDMTGGCFTEGETTLYVSRGLGNSAFPLRVFNHPEIVCVTLETAYKRPAGGDDTGKGA